MRKAKSPRFKGSCDEDAAALPSCSALGEHDPFFPRPIPIRRECLMLLHTLVESSGLLSCHVKIRALRAPQDAKTCQFRPRHQVLPRNHRPNAFDDSQLDAKLVTCELFTLADKLEQLDWLRLNSRRFGHLRQCDD